MQRDVVALPKEMGVPFLTVNSAKLYYEVDGSGPPLLLIMGLGGNSQVWAPIRRQLTARYQVILYDMQGTGRSERSPDPTTPETLVHEVNALLDHLELPRVLALGYSFGASVLLNYWKRSPERLQAISLVAGLYHVSPHARAFFDIQTELSQVLSRSQYIRQSFLWLCSEAYLEKNPDFFERMTSFLERSPVGVEPWSVSWKQFIGAFDSDYRGTLGELSIPTQVIHGSADKVSSCDHVREAVATVPAIDFQVVAGGGHALPWDAPEATVAALLPFLQKHQSSG